MLCPTRFVVDATENSNEGGVTAEVCSSQTGLRFLTLVQDIYARTRTTECIQRKKKEPPPEVRSRDRHVEHVCKISGSRLENGVDIWRLCGKRV